MTKSIRSRGYVRCVAGLILVFAHSAFAAGHNDCEQTLLAVKQHFCEVRKAPVVSLDSSVKNNEKLPFVPHHGSGRFESALAMNVQYEPIASLRRQISEILGNPLNFFKEWDPKGEAHVTVVTPVEYFDVLKAYVPIDRIDEIARENRLQEARIKIFGIGSGRANLDGKMEETLFLVVESEDLLRIRQKIYEEFLAKGGPKGSWDPKHFYSHITIGYTKRDLHEADGVIKDVFSSLDSRFNLSMKKAR